ncbi:MAG: family 20 glycosylhydrolase [Clostridia bacterium]|nr:family 20 glycosylhydrolase [Clostridia bacterium]
MVNRGKVFITGNQDKYKMVFPTPQYEEYSDEIYSLKEEYNTGDLYNFFIENKAGNDDITIDVNKMLSIDEHYIDITKDGIKITCSCEIGLFRAFASLIQLIDMGNGTKVPYTEIKDKPQFKNRGVMLDISRGRMPKPEKIKEMINHFARLKFNEFQLYMDNSTCFKSELFPKVTEGIECLTPEDIIELDNYCKERFITLVPVVPSFGHMETWLNLDEYKHLAVGDGEIITNTLNIIDPEAFEFVDKLYESRLPYFTSDRVLIGFDEAYGLGKYQLKEICEEKGEIQVYMDWLNKISDLCEKKYNKKAMFYTDMLRGKTEYFSQIPKNAIPVEWGYEDISSQSVPLACKSFNEAGFSYYVLPSVSTYKSISGRFDMTINNIRMMGEIGQEYNADGYVVSIWGDGGHPNAFVWAVVPMVLSAQYSWNVGIKQQDGWRKDYYLRNAWNYSDKYILGGKISKELSYAANYYLLEPIRIAVSTIIFQIYSVPLKQKIFPDFFDVDEMFDEFSFNHLILYMNEILDKIKTTDFNEIYKREAILGSEMVILSAKYALVKLAGSVTKEKAAEIKILSRKIIKEHRQLWLVEHYEKGVEIFENKLINREKELDEFII